VAGEESRSGFQLGTYNITLNEMIGKTEGLENSGTQSQRD